MIRQGRVESLHRDWTVHEVKIFTIRPVTERVCWLLMDLGMGWVLAELVKILNNVNELKKKKKMDLSKLIQSSRLLQSLQEDIPF